MGTNVISLAAKRPAPLPVLPTILVVEDDVLIRLMVADRLRDGHFAVLEASSADEAVILLQSQIPVHLVFTDVRMPGSMDGIALARLVRETRPELKLIVTSGNVASEHSADAFFRKPYDVEKIVKRIQELLADTDA
jgi:CheY-like chemotaxis protein